MKLTLSNIYGTKNVAYVEKWFTIASEPARLQIGDKTKGQFQHRIPDAMLYNST